MCFFISLLHNIDYVCDFPAPIGTSGSDSYSWRICRLDIFEKNWYRNFTSISSGKSAVPFLSILQHPSGLLYPAVYAVHQNSSTISIFQIFLELLTYLNLKPIPWWAQSHMKLLTTKKLLWVSGIFMIYSVHQGVKFRSRQKDKFSDLKVYNFGI